MKTAETFSITLPPQMARLAKSLAKKEGRTKSELFREAFRRYAALSQFREIQARAIEHSRELGLTEADVPRLVKEYRREQQAKANARSVTR